jgi:hypothetical protein
LAWWLGAQAAQKSRKMLAESTKEFRKMTDAEKVVTVKDLIRGYQEEVDTLTKRARASDGAFFSLYKDLFEAPDPADALRMAAAARPRAAASSLELEKLKAEVAAYEAEFKELKNQDITIRTLEEKLEDLEEAMDKQVALQVEAAKAELEAEASRRVDEVMPLLRGWLVLISTALPTLLSSNSSTNNNKKHFFVLCTQFLTSIYSPFQNQLCIVKLLLFLLAHSLSVFVVFQGVGAGGRFGAPRRIKLGPACRRPRRQRRPPNQALRKQPRPRRAARRAASRGRHLGGAEREARRGGAAAGARERPLAAAAGGLGKRPEPSRCRFELASPRRP